MKNIYLISALFFGSFFISLSIGAALRSGVENEKETKYNNTLQQSINPPPTMLPLLWEKGSPTRVEWSRHLFREIEKSFDTLDKASDMDYFCPNYSKLEHQQKINIWAQLFATMAYYESAFIPTARFVEPTRELDPVTKKPIVSEGLLQLGYSDSLYHGCNFNWEYDQQFSDEDPRKTILNPYKNLSCGVLIMADQIKKYGSISISRGAYWAVIKYDHRNEKIKQIKQTMINYSMCIE